MDTSHILLLTFLGVALLAGFLYWVGVLGPALELIKIVFDALVRWGFHSWQLLLSWADWRLSLLLAFVLLALGQTLGVRYPFLGVLIGAALVFFGAVTCLACIHIDQERAEVGRGYKALHSPVKGQELALHLVHYGPRVGVLLLVAATISVILGFAQLNQSLYYSVGERWYTVHDKPADEVDFGDFLGYTLFNLLRVIDLMDVVNSMSREVVIRTEVRQARWPSSTLLVLFKMFFSLLLLQQIFSALGRVKMLQQTVLDFWSPHPPIRERARDWLPLYGAEAVLPLFQSLRALEAVTAEQRAFLPRIIADIGPGAVPHLVRHLPDANENVRGIAVYSLGMLRARQAVPAVIRLADDPSDYVRQCLAESLGLICSAPEKPSRREIPPQIEPPAARSWFARLFFRERLKRLRPVDPVALSVAALRHGLRDPASVVRSGAAQSLGRIGADAAPATADLIAALKDASDAVRCQAAESLSLVSGPPDDVVKALVEQLAEPNPALQLAVVRSLGTLRQAAAGATQALVPLLHSDDEALRQAAAEAVGQIGTISPEALCQITEGLDSKDNLVRAQTAEMLGDIGATASDATPELVEALADDNDRVRGKAAQALGRMGESAAEALPQLVHALKDHDNWVSALAAEALGDIGASADGATSAKVVAGLTRSLRHANPHVRGKAAESLGKLGDDARPAAAALEEMAEKDEDASARRTALLALGEIGPLSERGSRLVLAALEDPHPETRAAALEALGKRGELREAALPAVLLALEDSNDLVQIEAAKALTSWTDSGPTVINGLCKLLQSVSPAVQAQAALALGKFGDKALASGPALVQAALQGNEDVREYALRALAQMQPPEAVTAFRAGLTDVRAEIRKLASAGLLKLMAVPEEVVPDLIQSLRDPEVRIRANAAATLAKQDALPPDAVPLLLECVTDPDDALRLNAALALRTVPSTKVLAAFEMLLADPNPRIHLLAADVLLLADPSHARAIETVIADLADPSPRARRTALGLVGVMSAAVPAFLKALRERVRVEEDPELSDLAGQLLEEMEKARSEEPATEEKVPAS